MPIFRHIALKSAGNVGGLYRLNNRLLSQSLTRPAHRHRGLKSQPRKTKRNPEGNSNALAGSIDTLGSWNNRLELSVNVEESIRTGKLIPRIDVEAVGANTEIGRRQYNEDRYLVTQLTPSLFLFGVFDGHGGVDTVDYVKRRITDHILYHIHRGEHNLHTVLTRAFVEINNSYARFAYHNYRGVGEQVFSSGSTATVCLLRSGIELVVAYVGDSRATLCREGHVVRLTHDHSPELDAEQTRIVKMGGRVVSTSLGKGRVNGRLDMSRSLGDLDLKHHGVIAEPDTRSIEVKHGQDAFLVITTDGVHKVLNSQEIVDLVNGCHDPHEASRFLLDQALLFGTEDNCTALVVPFGAWGKFANSGSAIQFSLSRNLSSRKYV